MHFTGDKVEARLSPYLRMTAGYAPEARAENVRFPGAATVNPGDDDDDDEDDDDKGKGGGNIDPDDDEGYGDDDDDDEEPLQVTSRSTGAPCRMLRCTILAFRSACPSGVPRRIMGQVRVRSQRRHTARSYWRATFGN
jgi:hypothetical protein